MREDEIVQVTDRLCLPPLVNPLSQKQCRAYLSMSQTAALVEAQQQIARICRQKLATPTGQAIHFCPGNTENHETYALHLIAGKGKELADFRAKRLLCLSLADRTITTPSIIVRQSNGRLVYAAVYQTPEGLILHSLIIGVEPGQEGRVITSMMSADKRKDKIAAKRELRKWLRRAQEIVYIKH